MAVTVVLRDGLTFVAVLRSAEHRVLIYEGWDEAKHLPSGQAETISIEEVAEIPVN